ncbi:MAG: zinc ribbon domain-containing protein [Armatimonadetes bacterium]|nr:zinc ribbon domain-containing protein [Armatimonadota bacterium]
MNRLLAGLSALLLLGGGAGILLGALSPWARVTLFHNMDLSLSGLLFADGGLCLAVALLVLLGMRRSAPLCLIAALLVLRWTAEARVQVPRRVKHQVVGAQLALFPLNRLLDQFHIVNVEVGDWNAPDPQLLAPGLSWTTEGALALLLGGLLGLPADPMVRWVHRHSARARCRACGARWPLSRTARFCPQCGASALPIDKRHCPACGASVSPRDRHCVRCGEALRGADPV